jgi:hypothetical protein
MRTQGISASANAAAVEGQHKKLGRRGTMKDRMGGGEIVKRVLQLSYDSPEPL